MVFTRKNVKACPTWIMVKPMAVNLGSTHLMSPVGAAFILETGPRTRRWLSPSLFIFILSSKKEETVIKSEDDPALGHQSELPDVATSDLIKVGLGNVVLIL